MSSSGRNTEQTILKKAKNPSSIRTYPGVALDLTEKEVPVIELGPKKGEKFGEIMFLGDLHIGSKGFSEHQFLAYIDWLKKNPEVRVVLMGDLLEVGELSSYIREEEDTFKQEVSKVISYLKPIKNQIICILEGNHEARFSRETKAAVNLSRYIALELGIVDKVLLPGPQKGQLFTVKCGSYYYPIYCIHGETSAIFNKGTQLRRMAFTTKVPLIVHGHTHQIYHDHYVYRSISKINNTFWESIFEQHWLITGCFVKYLGYAEEKSYPMSTIGAPIVRFSMKQEGIVIVTDAPFYYGIGRPEPEGNGPPGPWGNDTIADKEWLERKKRELNIKSISLRYPLIQRKFKVKAVEDGVITT